MTGLKGAAADSPTVNSSCDGMRRTSAPTKGRTAEKWQDQNRFRFTLRR